MVGGHGTNLGHPLFANIFGQGLLRHFGGEVVAALRGILVKGSLEEVQGLIDLTLQLFPAELEDLVVLAHVYAYLYAYHRLWKSSCQAVKLGNSLKKQVKQLNYYPARQSVRGVRVI